MYIIAVVIVLLIIIVVVVVIVVVIAVDGIVFVAVVIIVVVIITLRAILIWPVELGFIVGVRSDRNNMLHLAGRRCRHEVDRTLRHIVSSDCRVQVGIMGNIHGGGR